ncbi:MAG TPA: tetratricopeptide repeat protein [Bacteroidia bacterium]|nr:tetratricopeptide repeat protein [Bacteroidia bacterium]
MAWLNFIPQVVYIALFFGLFYLLSVKNPFVPAVLMWFALASALQNLVPRHHRRGMAFVKHGDYEPAIEHFENSYHFFTRNKWVDKYRSIVLLSISRISYREMALLNIAFCYSQTGEGEKAKEYYNRVLTEFPGSVMAQTALNMLNSMDSETD